MSLKHQLRYFEKQHLRPFLRRLRGVFPSLGTKAPVPVDLLARLESLETRLAELEQLIQEDLGLKMSQAEATTREPDGKP